MSAVAISASSRCVRCARRVGGKSASSVWSSSRPIWRRSSRAGTTGGVISCSSGGSRPSTVSALSSWVAGNCCSWWPSENWMS